MLKFTMTPFDLLFFGDARPFDKGSDASSIFPPLPNTVASAIFSRMYVEKGIIYQGKRLINAVYGPFLEKNKKIYFPCPLDVFVKDDDIVSLLPLENNDKGLIDVNNTDLGGKVENLMWLKGKASKDNKSFAGFISLEGLKKWYEDKEISKDCLLPYSDIYEKEERIGINIDNAKGTTVTEDGLFRVNFARLKEDISMVCWVDFNLSNLSEYFKTEDEIYNFYNKNPKILKLGGETRSVYYKCEKNDFLELFKNFTQINEKNDTKKTDTEKIVFLTPCILNEQNKNILEIMSGFKYGIIGKYFIAGINSKGKNLGTKTTKAIPAGSLFYMSSSKDKNNSKIEFFQENENFIGSNLILRKI